MNIIDADGAILGRLASYVAENAMKGKDIVVVNAEKCVLTGNKDQIFEKYRERYERGSKDWGPHYPRMPDRLLRRVVKEMLPHRKPSGKEAFKRVDVYLSVPDDIEKSNIEKVRHILADELGRNNYLRLGDVSRHLGWKPKEEL